MTIVFYILPFVEKRDVAHFVFTQSHKKKVYMCQKTSEKVWSLTCPKVVNVCPAFTMREPT